MTRRRMLGLVALVAVFILLGTVYFRLVEGWSWLDAYFFTVVTLSTVGYGNLVPVTVAGKIGTTVLIFFGIGVVAVAIQQLGHFAIVSQAETRSALREARAEARALELERRRARKDHA